MPVQVVPSVFGCNDLISVELEDDASKFGSVGGHGETEGVLGQTNEERGCCAFRCAKDKDTMELYIHRRSSMRREVAMAGRKPGQPSAQSIMVPLGSGGRSRPEMHGHHPSVH